MTGQYAPQAVGRNINPISNPRDEFSRGNRAAMNYASNAANENAAAALRSMLVGLDIHNVSNYLYISYIYCGRLPVAWQQVAGSSACIRYLCMYHYSLFVSI